MTRANPCRRRRATRARGGGRRAIHRGQRGQRSVLVVGRRGGRRETARESREEERCGARSGAPRRASGLPRRHGDLLLLGEPAVEDDGLDSHGSIATQHKSLAKDAPPRGCVWRPTTRPGSRRWTDTGAMSGSSRTPAPPTNDPCCCEHSRVRRGRVRAVRFRPGTFLFVSLASRL